MWSQLNEKDRGDGWYNLPDDAGIYNAVSQQLTDNLWAKMESRASHIPQGNFREALKLLFEKPSDEAMSIHRWMPPVAYILGDWEDDEDADFALLRPYLHKEFATLTQQGSFVGGLLDTLSSKAFPSIGNIAEMLGGGGDPMDLD